MIVQAMPYTAHADDSGKKNTPMLIVGGYIGESVRWELFQKTWMDKIKRAGIREFRRSSFNLKKYGEKFLLELQGLITGHAAYGFACGIDNAAWRMLSKEYAFELYHLVPYSICARTCVGLVREWCAKNSIDAAHMGYIFDKGSQDAGELTELLKMDVSLTARKTISSISSADSEDIAGIQAADYLSWLIRNQYMTNADAKEPEDLYPELRALLGREAFERGNERIPKFGFYHEKDLRKLIDSIPIPKWSDVPPEILNLKKPIRIKFPARLP
jgi:hypothetical protein